jgi:phosphatidylglycerol:prolipoprotein diacylglycerol transferase
MLRPLLRCYAPDFWREILITISISPIAFWNVRWYGIMIALAVVVLILWAMREVRRGANLSYDTILTAALVGIPSGVIISRLLHVIDNIVVAKLHPELALTGAVFDYTQHLGQIIGASGLTIWGAVLGATLGLWIYSRFSHLNFAYFADLLAPGVVLAQAVGRVGCTLNGCCYGLPTSLPWGVIYTHPESYGYLASLNLPAGMGLHPTQIYEIIYLLIIFAVLFSLRGRFKPDGSLFLVYLSLYSLWRIGIDFLREGTPFLFGLHQAQIIGIIVLAVAVPMLALRARWAKAGSGAE